MKNTAIPQISDKKPQPFLKWAGGKTQILKELVKYIPKKYNKYIEPFIGGGALFFYLEPVEAIIGDLNEDLIICYEVIRDNVEELINILQYYPYDKEFYYKLRETVPEDKIKRAVRMLYLNKTCFNGLYRVNKKGHFNVPFGKYKNPTICDVERLKSCSQALKGVTILNKHYLETFKMAEPGDFIYLDPPYQPISKHSDFKRYTKEFFYEKDQIELAEEVKRLVNLGCYVIVSNSDCDFIRNLYEDFKDTTYEVDAKRYINKNPQGRSGVKELVIVCNK